MVTCMVGTGQPSALQVSSRVCPSVTVVGPVRAVISGGAGWRHKYSESERVVETGVKTPH